MSKENSVLKEFLRDVRHHPDSFNGLSYQELVKTIKDIENQSLGGKMDEGLFLSSEVKPAYELDLLPITKYGFKDIRHTVKMLPAVRFELVTSWGKPSIKRMQLLIHASDARPAHVCVRVLYEGRPEWVLYSCGTSTVVNTINFAQR